MFEFDPAQRYLVRTNRAGVFYAKVKEMDERRNAVLVDSQMIFWWEKAAALSQLAMEGTKAPEVCKFTMILPIRWVAEVIEILPCTPEACANIEGVKIWKE
jgi:hypothetical protein